MINVPILTPSTLSKRQVCYILVPVWLLWTYIIYLIFTNHNYAHNAYKLEFKQKIANESEPVALQNNFLSQINGTLNRAKIGRIYEYLGGSNDGNGNIKIMKRMDNGKFRASKKKIPGCKVVPESLGKILLSLIN